MEPNREKQPFSSGRKSPWGISKYVLFNPQMRTCLILMLWLKQHRQFDIILGGTDIRFYFYFMDMFWSINIPSWINKSSERKIKWPQKTLSSTLFLGGINVFLRLQDYFHAFGHQITFTNEQIFSTKNELNPQGNIFNCLVLNAIQRTFFDQEYPDFWT